MGSVTNADSQATSRRWDDSIIDIRSDKAGIELKREIANGLRRDSKQDEKSLPTLLLYDEAGLKLFEKITYLDQYYLTNEEIGLLEDSAAKIAEKIPNNAMVVELGSGNLRKVNILLRALDRAEKRINYYALDLMKTELERTLDQVPEYNHVKCFGLHGTYDDGLDFLKLPKHDKVPKVILSLGSSIGNFTRDDAESFLKQYIDLLGPQDAFLIGLDACQEPTKVFEAYNDRDNVTYDFTMNGLEHANRLLGYDAFHKPDWTSVGEYDEDGARHRAYVVPLRDLTIEGVSLRKGEWINIEESYKYSQDQSNTLWRKSGAIEGAFWANASGSYALHLLKKPPIMFPTAPEQYAAKPAPSLDDWNELWKSWDLVTRQMIPESQLLSKPIDLRNVCLFYLGHIPTFLDMKIVEALGGKPTEPSYFYNIFERGIDPDVDNPERCHAHSEIPENWPSVQEILAFQDRLRQRVTDLYASGHADQDATTARVLWLGFEHEIMHLETLLYMLLQSDTTLPPAGTVAPDFAQLAARAKQNAVENQWFDIPAQTLSVGLDDAESPEGPTRYFGWDAEKPSRKISVPAFKAQGRPISNGEYARFMKITGITDIPKSWASQDVSNGMNGHTNGLSSGRTNGHSSEDDDLHDFVQGKFVRTVYGLVPLQYALEWPVSASYDELAGCAQYMGGRIPSEDEARSIYHFVEQAKKKEASKLSGTIPAVNGHLVNDGVEETPPPNPSLNGSGVHAGLNPHDTFVNLDDANVGFKRWHPMPVTQKGNKLAGLAGMGGLWEATSTPLTKHDGFAPMKLYPAFSDDFYDGKHLVVLGGSWATHPRLAGRKTFVNWYQHNYRYAWIGGRLVKDA